MQADEDDEDGEEDEESRREGSAPFATELDGVDEFGTLAGEGPVVDGVVAAECDEAALQSTDRENY